MANAALDALLDGLNAALCQAIRPGTGLYDALDDGPSPADHYGHVCAALALACAGPAAWPAGRLALDAWLALDERALGHLPFNRLALLLLRLVLARHGLAAADADRIEAGLRRCALRRHYPSNNWSLLAQTCRLIEAPAELKPRECRRLCAQLARWTTAKGAFIDFPAAPGKRFSTPLAYHHKALFLTALACRLHDDDALAGHAARLCDWLVHCWDPAGYAGGFGRSNHALFGDACLLAGLMLHGIDDGAPQGPIGALATRLGRQRRADGLLWLDPAGPESGRASWDAYMHLSVYNAWAAAIVGAARVLGAREGRLASWRAHRQGLFHDTEAGIACLRTATGLTAVLSTHGQPPQSYGSSDCDLRYAGGVIFHLSDRARGPLLPPPTRATRATLMPHPELAGQTPLFEVDGELHALTEFRQAAIEQRGDAVRLELAGATRPLFRPPPRTRWHRLLAAIDWRWLGGRLNRRQLLTRRVRPALEARLQITLDLSQPLMLRRTLELSTPAGTRARFLNPDGLGAIGTAPDAGARIAVPAASLPGAHYRCGAAEALPAGPLLRQSADRLVPP